MAVHSFMTFILLLLAAASFAAATAAAANSSSAPPIGINYGQVANNLPTPSAVLPLLRSLGISRVKLYDADPVVLRAFANTDVEFVVGLPDLHLPSAATNPSAALSWVKTNIQPFASKTHISAVTVGNEVLTSNNTALIASLVPAMQSIHAALVSLNLDRRIAVTTAHSLSVLASSYPPSAATFRRDLLPVVAPLLAFLAKTDAPFLINAYPYFAYKADPKRVALDYVLFQPNAGVADAASGLKYTNMLHAQVDAVRAAVAAAAPPTGKEIEVVVSETGWPSAGDEDEAGATPENARRYNGNLIRMVAEGRGTPMKPETPLGVYVFAMFNENLKPGPASERHYGLFDPDGSPAYKLGNLGLVVSNSSYTGGGDDGGAAAESPAHPVGLGASTSANYYTISSSTDLIWRLEAAMMAAAGFVLLLA